MLFVALRANMDTTLRQALLEHCVDIHEWLHGNAFDALPEQFAQLRPPTKQCIASQPHQRAQAQIAVLADVAEKIGDCWVCQRALFAQQPQQRLLDQPA